MPVVVTKVVAVILPKKSINGMNERWAGGPSLIFVALPIISTGTYGELGEYSKVLYRGHYRVVPRSTVDRPIQYLYIRTVPRHDVYQQYGSEQTSP